jgi:hypothetical protein
MNPNRCELRYADVRIEQAHAVDRGGLSRALAEQGARQPAGRFFTAAKARANALRVVTCLAGEKNAPPRFAAPLQLMGDVRQTEHKSIDLQKSNRGVKVFEG